MPRLVCVLPPHTSDLTPTERTLESWSERLWTWIGDGKTKGKGTCTQSYRICFCGDHDLSLAGCGPDGRGYAVTEVLAWVKKVWKGAGFVVPIGIIVLNMFTGLALPTEEIVSAFANEIGHSVIAEIGEGMKICSDAMESKVAEKLTDYDAAPSFTVNNPLSKIGVAGCRR